MDKTLVSVIIPTYNRSRFLSKSVNSVLKQTYRNLEIIIIDDCSTDNTEFVVGQMSDSRICYIKNNKNRGIAYSLNRGIQKASGAYIAILGDDDEWMNEKIEKQVALIKDLPPDYGIVYCGYAFYDNRGESYKSIVPRRKGDVLKYMLSNSIMGGHTPLIRKEVFEKSGLHNENLTSAVDWEIWIRIAQHYKFDFVDSCMAKYIIHGKQVSTDFEKKILNYRKILSIHFSLFKKYNKVNEMRKKLFRLYIINKNFKKAYRELRYCTQEDGKHINSYIQIVMIITMPKILRILIHKRSFLHIDNITLY